MLRITQYFLHRLQVWGMKYSFIIQAPWRHLVASEAAQLEEQLSTISKLLFSAPKAVPKFWPFQRSDSVPKVCFSFPPPPFSLFPFPSLTFRISRLKWERKSQIKYREIILNPFFNPGGFLIFPLFSVFNWTSKVICGERIPHLAPEVTKIPKKCAFAAKKWKPRNVGGSLSSREGEIFFISHTWCQTMPAFGFFNPWSLVLAPMVRMNTVGICHLPYSLGICQLIYWVWLIT